MRPARRNRDANRWTFFFQHLRIFIYVIALLSAIDLIGGTDDLFVPWAAAIWGAILGMHFIETAFFGGGLFGMGTHHRFEPVERSDAQNEPTNTQMQGKL